MRQEIKEGKVLITLLPLRNVKKAKAAFFHLFLAKYRVGRDGTHPYTIEILCPNTENWVYVHQNSIKQETIPVYTGDAFGKELWYYISEDDTALIRELISELQKEENNV